MTQVLLEFLELSFSMKQYQLHFKKLQSTLEHSAVFQLESLEFEYPHSQIDELVELEMHIFPTHLDADQAPVQGLQCEQEKTLFIDHLQGQLCEGK